MNELVFKHFNQSIRFYLVFYSNRNSKIFKFRGKFYSKLKLFFKVFNIMELRLDHTVEFLFRYHIFSIYLYTLV